MSDNFSYDKCHAAIAALQAAAHQLRQAGLWKTYQLLDKAVKEVGFEVEHNANKFLKPPKPTRRGK